MPNAPDSVLAQIEREVGSACIGDPIGVTTLEVIRGVALERFRARARAGDRDCALVVDVHTKVASNDPTAVLLTPIIEVFGVRLRVDG